MIGEKSIMDAKVEETLDKLNIPTQKELEEIRIKLDQLTKKIEERRE